MRLRQNTTVDQLNHAIRSSDENLALMRAYRASLIFALEPGFNL